MIIVLDDTLCTTDHALLCVCTILARMSWSLCLMTSLYCWPCPDVCLFCTYQHVIIIVLDDELCTAEHILLCVCNVLTSMSWSLCWMRSSVLLTTSCIVTVWYLHVPACHDHCAGWWALYYWPLHAVCLYCTYKHVMIIVLDDKLCTTDHFMLCAWTVLINMSRSLCWTAELVLLCVCTVLNCMSWSFSWMMSFVLLNKSCFVSVLYLPASHDHCAGWLALYYWPNPTVRL